MDNSNVSNANSSTERPVRFNIFRLIINFFFGWKSNIQPQAANNPSASSVINATRENRSKTKVIGNEGLPEEQVAHILPKFAGWDKSKTKHQSASFITLPVINAETGEIELEKESVLNEIDLDQLNGTHLLEANSMKELEDNSEEPKLENQCLNHINLMQAKLQQIEKCYQSLSNDQMCNDFDNTEKQLRESCSIKEWLHNTNEILRCSGSDQKGNEDMVAALREICSDIMTNIQLLEHESEAMLSRKKRIDDLEKSIETTFEQIKDRFPKLEGEN